ncbi:hypothetical protein SORBI_3002G099401 [Sorghum bicolor]|uniref:Uncharacterized protein n=1 Tax=Sorghum bicolor TaxID=4558 RepID=A0A1W0W348_SORBI|nr:hypothetical protein SORBI_3002G099401 [Sorghum bicolor]
MPLALSADFGFSDLLARNVGDCRNSLVFFESLISSFSDDLHATLLPADQGNDALCYRVNACPYPGSRTISRLQH